MEVFWGYIINYFEEIEIHYLYSTERMIAVFLKFMFLVIPYQYSYLLPQAFVIIDTSTANDTFSARLITDLHDCGAV